MVCDSYMSALESVVPADEMSDFSGDADKMGSSFTFAKIYAWRANRPEGRVVS